MQTYSFPAPCCDFTSLVARSTHTMRLPVTLGSKVPLWPVFVTRRMRRIQATTSCEDGLDGLSRLMTPYLETSRLAIRAYQLCCHCRQLYLRYS